MLRNSVFTILIIILSFDYLAGQDQQRFSISSFETSTNSSQIKVVDSFNLLSLEVVDSLKTLSKEYAERALTISRMIKYLKGEGLASLNLGIYYLYSKQYPIGLEYLFNSLALSNQSQDLKLKALALNKICLVFINLRILDKARYYNKMALSLATSISDTNIIIESLIRSSDISKIEGKNIKALTTLYQALWLSNKKADIRRIAGVNKYIGNCFLQMKDYENAEYYYKRTIDLSLKKNFYIDIGTLYTSIALIHQYENDLDASLKYNFLALQIRKQAQQEDLVSSSLLNIGRTYMLMNMTDSAIIHFKRCLELADKLEINILQELGNKYFYEIYLKQGNYQKALQYYIAYKKANEKLNLSYKKEESELIEANQIIIENEKKSALLIAENELQKTRIKYNRIQIIFLIFFSFTLIGVTYYVYRQFISNKRSKMALEVLNKQLDAEIEERKLIETQLSKSEALHHFLTDNAMDVISRIDNTYNYVYVSPSCERVYGYTQQELMEIGDIFFRADEMVRRGLKSKFDEMIAARIPLKLTYQNAKKDGSLFWVESHLNPIYDEVKGEFRELISVSRDVSDRIRYEESLIENARQKEFLMKEIHHRTKNNFAILISLLNIQKYQSGNKDLFPIINDLQSRIRTMVLIHEQLHRSSSVDVVDFGPYVRNLSTIVSGAFKTDGISLSLDIAECNLNIETALPLGLIINELLTNSFKYAFPGRKNGNIHIRLAPYTEPETSKNLWELVVEDDGIGLPESFDLKNSNSMGSLIVITLADQIRASVEFTGTAGTSFRIIFDGTPETT